MKWSEKDFQERVRAFARRRGITLTALLQRAGVTEDYLRHPPEVGRNIAGILKIAEALDVPPAELMGLELSNTERRSTMMIAHIMAHLHFNGLPLSRSGNSAAEIQAIVAAVMGALKQYENTSPRAEARPPKVKPAQPKRAE